MDGDATREMDEAWRAYLVERDEKPEHLRFGWNPKKSFIAGYLAGAKFASRDDAEVRSSGWANHGSTAH